MLEENLERELLSATAPQEICRQMEVDVVPTGDRRGGARIEAGPLELLGAPTLDERDLVRRSLKFCRSHFDHSPLASTSPFRRFRMPPGRGIPEGITEI